MSRISLDATCHSSTGSLSVSTLLPTLRYLSHRSSLRRREAPNVGTHATPLCRLHGPGWRLYLWLANVSRPETVVLHHTSQLARLIRVESRCYSLLGSDPCAPLPPRLSFSRTPLPARLHSPFPCLCRFQLGNEVLRSRCCPRSDGLQCSLVLQNSALGLSVQHGGRMVCCDGRCS